MTWADSRWSWIAALCAALALSLTGAGAGCGGGQKASAVPHVAADEDDGGDRAGSRRAASPDVDEEEDNSDGAEIAGLGGRLEVYDIERGFKPHEDALVACFTRKVGKNRFIGGNVELAFVVGRDGVVKSVHFANSDLGAWPMEKCMLDIARTMTFARPKGSGDADFTIPLAFDARQAVVLWNETRGAQEIDEARRLELAACAEDTATDDPRNVWITMYVGTRGKVMSVGFASPDGPLADEWASCAEAKAGAWKLSDPRGRAKLVYQYNP